MTKITEEFIEKYNLVRDLAKKEFPENEWLIEPLIWEDGTFIIQAKHNKTNTVYNKWSCRIAIASEEANRKSEVSQGIFFHNNTKENNEELIVWEDDNFWWTRKEE